MTIELAAFNRLLPPAANPRTAMDAAKVEGLAASILADGILQNLVVRRRKGNRLEIVSGERRYRALELLISRGDIADDYPVPVEVRKVSDDDAIRIATVENIQRENLHPMDEAEAFARMVKDGDALCDIAAKAGVSVGTVKRRLALANLCAEAKTALREGELSLSEAEALTLGSPDQQREALEWALNSSWVGADDIRRRFLDAKPSVADALFPFASYSGSVTADLFGSDEDTYFDDVEQFLRLQNEAVEARAAAYREAGHTVEIVREPYVSWWQYGEAEEADMLAHVVIHMKPSGLVEIREGLIQPRKPAPAACRDDGAGEGEVSVKTKPEYAAPLRRYIAAHKTLAVQEVLLSNPRKAKEIGVCQMLRAHDGHGPNVSCDPHPALAWFVGQDEPSASYAAIERTAAEWCATLGVSGNDRYGYPCRGPWEALLKPHKNPLAVYEAVKGLSDTELEQLHLFLSVLSFGQGVMDELDEGESLFNAVACDLDIDMADHWRPDEAFLSRRSTAQLGEIVRASGAEERIGNPKGWKKVELVAGLQRHFERGETEAARGWVPAAMRFPAAVQEAAADVASVVREDVACDDGEGYGGCDHAIDQPPAVAA